MVSCSPYQGQLGNEEFLYFLCQIITAVHRRCAAWRHRGGVVRVRVEGGGKRARASGTTREKEGRAGGSGRRDWGRNAGGGRAAGRAAGRTYLAGLAMIRRVALTGHVGRQVYISKRGIPTSKAGLSLHMGLQLFQTLKNFSLSLPDVDMLPPVFRHARRRQAKAKRHPHIESASLHRRIWSGGLSRETR